MNAALLHQEIAGDEDKVFTILETLEYFPISYNPTKRQFRFSRSEGQNPTSMVLDVETLRFYCFSTNDRGDIFTLIMKRLNCTFPESLKLAATVLGLDEGALSIKTRYPFHGFYLALMPDDENDFDVPSIPEEALEPYLGKLNTQFFRSGIDYKTQELFQVGYDDTSNRITVPERNFNGELCGIMGRSNDPDCPHEDRWLPIVACSRSKTLFGLQHNYQHIVERRSVFLYESEKAPMQMHSIGCGLALGLCGCHVSKAQAAMINSMQPKRVILALDEGLEEEAVREEAKKLIQNNQILKNKVGYVWDADGEIIPKGSKANPADLGREAYIEIMKTKVRWLDG